MANMGTKIQLSTLMNKALNKLQSAKSKLMLEYPYFGSVASTLIFEQNDDIESFQSDGSIFKYNEEFLNDCDIDEIEFMLANASMHYALSHKTRENKRDPNLWQLATDYAVNSMLLKNKLSPPKKINYQSRFDDMYAERIYAVLESETDYSDHEQEIRKNKKTIRENDSKESEFLEQILQKAISKEELPKDLDRFFPKIRKSKIDWREKLHRYLNSYQKEDYHFFPPNKRYIHQGIALPSLGGEFLKLIVAIDTSGSIDERLLGEFFAEFENIMQSFSNYEINLIACDNKIRYKKTFYPAQTIDYKIKGGGATDFRPVFELIEKEIDDAALLIYFTDAQGIFPKHKPYFDTLWVLSQDVKIPFGESIVIEFFEK